MAIATYTLANYIQDLRTVTSATQDRTKLLRGLVRSPSAPPYPENGSSHITTHVTRNRASACIYSMRNRTILWQSLLLPGSPDAEPRHITMAPGQWSLGSMGSKRISSGNALMMARALATRRSTERREAFQFWGRGGVSPPRNPQCRE